MKRVETVKGLYVGEPIALGDKKSQYPVNLFGRELEEIGYAATKTAFEDVHTDEEIRFQFDPDDPKKIAKRVKMIEELGHTGVCWAVPEYAGRQARAPHRLVGFGLITTNKSPSKLVNIAAERVFRRPAVAEVAMIHVRPECREQGIGSLLLSRLAATAHRQGLMTRPAVTVLDGYTTAQEFFKFYKLIRSEEQPEQRLRDYWGPGKDATAHIYEGESWDIVLGRLGTYGRLPGATPEDA